MMKKYSGLFCVALLVLGAGCTEFLSPDVEDVEIQITSPKDSLYTSAAMVTFWWEEEVDAEGYRLQVVTPDFDNPDVVLDTLMLENQLAMSLEEGIYTWRVRVENESSISEYQQRVCFVDRTDPLKAQAISPMDSAMVVLGNSLELRWESRDGLLDGKAFPTADSVYLYELFGTEPVLLDRFYVGIDENKSVDIRSSFPSAASGEYLWEVRAIDLAGNKSLSDLFLFEVVD